MTRASDAARDAATERLKDAYVRGTLNIEEFHVRVSNALAASTVADLATLTCDVRATPAPSHRFHPPRRQRFVSKGAVAVSASGSRRSSSEPWAGEVPQPS